MSGSLYKQTVPPLTKYLRNLSGVLEKSVKFADEKGIKHEELLNYRLIEDMRPLPYQVQSCSNTVKFLATRVAGLETAKLADDETTFEQLQARIARTIEILNQIKPEDMDKNVDQPIIMDLTKVVYRFQSGQNYVSDFALPNFHFHLSTAYCLMRQKGVPIDAMDYLGKDTFVAYTPEGENK